MTSSSGRSLGETYATRTADHRAGGGDGRERQPAAARTQPAGRPPRLACPAGGVLAATGRRMTVAAVATRSRGFRTTPHPPPPPLWPAASDRRGRGPPPRRTGTPNVGRHPRVGRRAEVEVPPAPLGSARIVPPGGRRRRAGDLCGNEAPPPTRPSARRGGGRQRQAGAGPSGKTSARHHAGCCGPARWQSWLAADWPPHGDRHVDASGGGNEPTAAAPLRAPCTEHFLPFKSSQERAYKYNLSYQIYVREYIQEGQKNGLDPRHPPICAFLPV